MSKNKTVTAWAGPGVKVRISLPLEQIQETTAGHREIETGVYRLGLHIGRKWGVVHNYSIWTNRFSKGGECFGDIFWAYDLTNAHDREQFIKQFYNTRCGADLVTYAVGNGL